MGSKKLLFLALLAASFPDVVEPLSGLSLAAKYLIVSAPANSKVVYIKIKPAGHGQGQHAETEVHDLITGGLAHPQGLAVDQRGQQLLVADPSKRKVFVYKLHTYRGRLSVGPQSVLANGTEARWVAVDGIGGAFFTDEPQNQILKVTLPEGKHGNSSSPQVLYDGASVTSVNAPGGIGVDNFNAFWANKQIGTQVGSVVKGRPSLPDMNGRPMRPAMQVLSRNTDKSYGVCVALNNVYYTQPETTLYGVKKAGGSPVLISSLFKQPRGCAYDGEGTVYVADKGADAVYSFAGNMPNLAAAQLSKTVSLQDAFGIAVYSGASRSASAGAVALALVAAGSALAHVLPGRLA